MLPARAYLGYVRRLAGLELDDCSDAVRSVRAVKSAVGSRADGGRLEQVRRGAEAVPALIGAGVSEASVQLEVERVMRKAGHQGQLRFRGFNQEMHYGQILGGAERRRARLLRLAAVRPRAQPGDRQGAGRPRARAAATRSSPTWWAATRAGSPTRRAPSRSGRRRADLAAAYATAVAILRAVEARAAARGGAVGAVRPGRARWPPPPGLGEHFMGAGAERVRFLGHGVGMEIDELPILAPGFDEPLVEGNVVAIEPKFVFPGRGAVGIENMYARHRIRATRRSPPRPRS